MSLYVLDLKALLPSFFFLGFFFLISANGLSLGSDVANSFVDNNMGVTAGYTVFALTIQWGACVVFSITGSSLENEERKTITVSFSSNLESVSCIRVMITGYVDMIKPV